MRLITVVSAIYKLRIHHNDPGHKFKKAFRNNYMSITDISVVQLNTHN